MYNKLKLLALLLLIFACGKDEDDNFDPAIDDRVVTIFFINDPHSQLNNFAKIKHIVDAEQNGNVLLVAAGDIFSGSPYVDQHEEKGYPIIDVMNQAGFDVAVLGNHEFDYGIETLEARINQSTFPWICANIDTESSVLTQPEPFITLEVGESTVTFLGLVETNGHPEKIIPATHPWRVIDVSFERFENMVGQYSDLKAQEDADILVGLTHLGLFADQYLAQEFPYFDLIIGGHSNHLNQTSTNNIPTLMAGRNLSHLGRVDISLDDLGIRDISSSLIDLEDYESFDEGLMSVIGTYENNNAFDEVIGFATSHHDRIELGCFYTDALKTYMNVDMTIQNNGGIRSELDMGDISKFEIYSIDPFNNGSVVFTKTAREIKDFFIETGAGFHVSGVELITNGQDIIMRDAAGNEISDNTTLTLGINDYIPAVFESYFNINDADIRPLTTAESLVDYLSNTNSTVAHEGCNQYFRY